MSRNVISCSRHFIDVYRALFFLFSFSLLCGLHAQKAEISWAGAVHPSGPVSEAVYGTYQDSSGFMWFGASTGLFRYDGREYIKWNRYKSDFFIPGSHISSLIGKGNKVLMIADEHDILEMNTSDCSFRTLYQSEKEKLRKIIWLNSSTILLSTSKNNLVWIDTKSGREVRRRKFPFVIQHISFDGNCIWLGTRNPGLVRLCGEDLEVTSPDSNIPFPGFSVEAVLPFNDTLVLFGGWDNAIHFLNPVTGRRSDLVIDEGGELIYSGEQITVIEKISDNKVWIGTKFSGVFKLNLKTGEVKRLRGRNFVGTCVHSIYIDHWGRRWVTTDKGINFWDALYGKFTAIPVPGAREIFSIKEKNGQLIVGTDSGLVYYPDIKGTPKNYKLRDQNRRLEVHSIDWSGEEALLGTNVSLYYFNPDNGKSRSALVPNLKFGHFNPNSLVSSRFNNVYRVNSDSGRVIIASAPGFGILKYNEATTKAVGNTLLSNSGRGYVITSVILNSKGQIDWTSCFENGIYGGVTNRTEGEKNKDVFRAKIHLQPNITGITSMQPCSKGGYWVCTAASGLYYFNPRLQNSFQRIIKSVHSPEAVLEDSLGRLWIIEAGSLILYNVRLSTLYRFSENTGLPARNVSAPFEKGTDDYFYLAADNAVIRFKPELIRPSKRTVDLNVLGFRNQNNRLISASGEPVFHEKENLVRVEYSVPAVLPGMEINYRYKLDGASPNWVNAGSGNSISFSNLAPGEYTLHLQAYSEAGQEFSEISSVSFTIESWWWRTWWFGLILIWIFVLTVVAIYRYRINVLLKTQLLRDRIARDLHDDVGSTLGAINIYTSAGINAMRRDDKGKVLEVLEKIGKYAREMSADMNDIIWAVDSKNDEFTHFSSRIRLYLEEVLMDSGISYEFYADPSVLNRHLSMDVRRNLHLIVKECLNNALKYSGCSSIKVQFLEEDGHLVLRFADNGRGFDLNQKSEGNGLRNMRQRAAEIGAKLEILSQPDRGTEICISI